MRRPAICRQFTSGPKIQYVNELIISYLQLICEKKQDIIPVFLLCIVCVFTMFSLCIVCVFFVFLWGSSVFFCVSEGRMTDFSGAFFPDANSLVNSLAYDYGGQRFYCGLMQG